MKTSWIDKLKLKQERGLLFSTGSMKQAIYTSIELNTFGIIDCYLPIEQETIRDYLQLMGVTSLFIFELYPLSMDDFVIIIDKPYTKQEILTWEQFVVATSDLTLVPIHESSLTFLELTSIDYSMGSISKLAASKLFSKIFLQAFDITFRLNKNFINFVENKFLETFKKEVFLEYLQ